MDYVEYLTAKAISTHAPRTGSDEDYGTKWRCWEISTHAPRTGSDAFVLNALLLCRLISTHAPRTGSDYPSGGC